MIVFDKTVTNEGPDTLGLYQHLQEYGESYGIPDHVFTNEAAAMIRDSFMRKIQAELEMMEITVVKRIVDPAIEPED